MRASLWAGERACSLARQNLKSSSSRSLAGLKIEVAQLALARSRKFWPIFCTLIITPLNSSTCHSSTCHSLVWTSALLTEHDPNFQTDSSFMVFFKSQLSADTERVLNMTVSTEFVCPVQTNPMIKCSYDNDEGSICVRKDCKNSSVSSCNCVNGLCSWSVGEPSKRKKWKNKLNVFKFSLSDVGKRLFGWRLWKLRKSWVAIGWKLCLVRK